MLLLIILVHIVLINANLHINETTYKIKYILTKYKTYRHKRCANSNSEYLKIQNFAENTLKVLEKTERYGEFLKFHNVSDCNSSEKDSLYKKQHIVNGFLVHDEVPRTHWEEYKKYNGRYISGLEALIISLKDIKRTKDMRILLLALAGDFRVPSNFTDSAERISNYRSKAYNKFYASLLHEMSALNTWENNLKRVARHNREYLAGNQSYSLHLNHFGDWSIAAYIKQLLKLITTIPLFDPAHDHKKQAYRDSLHRSIPKKIDWRAKGFRPKREEQFHCGACYAFAVAHALQAQVYKRHGDWSELSPQQIVDCSLKDGNFGCDGGSLQAAMRYAARDGLMMEAYYPYKGKKGYCHYNNLAISARVRRWATLPSGDEEAIERAVATIGPLAVAVNAAPITFQLYRSGIYDDPFCVPWSLNHAMLLIGYTPDYWILLNWWGKQWGEDGYMRIRRGFNICGVTNMATYVEL